MPQDTHVLCCYSCKMFQVHIVKKAKKWQCKICNEKQSIQRVYFQGSGSDCRINVQKLNSLKGNLTNLETSSFEAAPNSSIFLSDDNCPPSSHAVIQQNKWGKYLCASTSTPGCAHVPTEIQKNNMEDSNAITFTKNPDDISSFSVIHTDKNIFETGEDFDITVDF